MLKFCTIFNSSTIYKLLYLHFYLKIGEPCLFAINIEVTIFGWVVLLPLQLPMQLPLQLPMQLPRLPYQLFYTSKAIWCLCFIINTQRSFNIFQNKSEPWDKIWKPVYFVEILCFKFYIRAVKLCEVNSDTDRSE